MKLDNFFRYEKVNGKSDSTIKNHKSLLVNANIWKPLDTWIKDDVDHYLVRNKDNGEPYGRSKVEWDKQTFKTFFAWLEKPELVNHLIVKTIKNSLIRDDILMVEDVNKLIESTDSTLYKSLIAFLFESGARISEALALKRKDIQETDKGMIISVPQTKTGKDYRRSLYIYSAGYIRNHIAYCGLDLNDALFFGYKRDDKGHKLPMSAVAAWGMLGKIGEKAGIEKGVNPHAFRHAQCTDMILRGYNETIIRKKLGWTGDSRMIARYQHIVDDDVINATAEKAGKDIIRQPIANLNQAESLSIANASMQLSKLSEENQELKERMAQRDIDFEEMKQQRIKDMEKITKFLEMGGLKILKKG